MTVVRDAQGVVVRHAVSVRVDTVAVMRVRVRREVLQESLRLLSVVDLVVVVVLLPLHRRLTNAGKKEGVIQEAYHRQRPWREQSLAFQC